MPADVLVPTSVQALTEVQHTEGHAMVVVGRIEALYTETCTPRAADQRFGLWCVSVPVINLENKLDSQRFLAANGSGLNEEAVQQEMRLKWRLVLLALGDQGVQVPVVCPLGTPHDWDVHTPRMLALCAKALHDVWTSPWLQGTWERYFQRTVIVACPQHFHGPQAYDVFRAQFPDSTPLGVAVTTREMLPVAEWASRPPQGKQLNQTGIINPSAVEAMRYGCIGMSWHELPQGRVSPEAMLAVSTTLLFHHVSLCPMGWSDQKKQYSPSWVEGETDEEKQKYGVMIP